MYKYIPIFLFLICSCATDSALDIPIKKAEKLSVTANRVIPKARVCFKKEYGDQEKIFQTVDVYFDIFSDGHVLVTKIKSKQKVTKKFKKCIQRTYESFEFTDPVIEEGKKIKFKQRLEFRSLLKV